MNESAGEKVSTFVAGDKVLVDGKKVGTIVSQEGENSLVKLFSGNETERIANKRIRLSRGSLTFTRWLTLAGCS